MDKKSSSGTDQTKKRVNDVLRGRKGGAHQRVDKKRSRAKEKQISRTLFKTEQCSVFYWGSGSVDWMGELFARKDMIGNPKVGPVGLTKKNYFKIILLKNNFFA